MSPSGPQTILFADVSGGTGLLEAKGEPEARRLMAAVLDALAEVCRRHGGQVARALGDEIMCTFPAAPNGVLAACDMQRRMARDAGFVRDHLAVRIGLHHGDALEEDDGEVFGDAVSTAARMVSLARREQIVTTAATYDSLSGQLPEARGLGKVRVSGKLLPISIVELVWQDDVAGVTRGQLAGRSGESAAAGEMLRLRHRGRVVELRPDSEPFSMGREPTNQLQVEADWVSRSHALIVYRGGHFQLSDRSTNGTFVRIGDDDELKVHRDQVTLGKAGTISLGQAVAVNTGDVIHFQTS